MATAAQSVTAVQPIQSAAGPLQWFQEFLKEELKPSPGRAALVVRMTIASTVMMLFTMVFRIPYGAYGSIYALTISRENPQTTVKAVKTIIVAFLFSIAYVLIGALLFLHDPNLRLLWVIGTMFVMFFALSAGANYTAAARFGYLLVITIPLWDRHIATELKVEGTLWVFAAISLGSLITVLVELAYSHLYPRDDLLHPIAERLSVVEEALNSFAAGRPLDEKLNKQITRYAMIGTATLRRTLQRSGYPPQYREQMGALAAIIRRLVDLTANARPLQFNLDQNARDRIRGLAEELATFRRDLLARRIPAHSDSPPGTSLEAVPILSEIEQTALALPEAFAGSASSPAFSSLPSSGSDQFRIFARDAFSNPEHMKFALKGCFAASLCYLIYNLKDWPGISTAVTTCLLTALTTIGSSRQKQALRISGAIFGGVVLGIGTQVFVLPYLDSIGGFLLVFVACTLIASWFATSSPRLSYFGVQVAVAFYLINLTDFAPQTSLEPARDRVIGILLGLVVMWFVFDQLWSTSAANLMKTKFVSNLRAMAQLVREPLAGQEESWDSDSLRENINESFDTVRNVADGVLFELGRSRQQDLALRSRILGWLPQLQTLFVTRVALLKYRVQVSGFELPDTVRAAQVDFDNSSAEILEDMAKRLEGKVVAPKRDCQEVLQQLERSIQSYWLQQPKTEFSVHINSFLTLCRTFESLMSSVYRQV